MDSNKIIYTHDTSPLYRERTTKMGPLNPENCPMVGRKRRYIFAGAKMETSGRQLEKSRINSGFLLASYRRRTPTEFSPLMSYP